MSKVIDTTFVFSLIWMSLHATTQILTLSPNNSFLSFFLSFFFYYSTYDLRTWSNHRLSRSVRIPFIFRIQPVLNFKRTPFQRGSSRRKSRARRQMMKLFPFSFLQFFICEQKFLADARKYIGKLSARTSERGRNMSGRTHGRFPRTRVNFLLRWRWKDQNNHLANCPSSCPPIPLRAFQLVNSRSCYCFAPKLTLSHSF